jgi:flavin reductase (DIM6/NTAB) family NADH-FMN oxidoreductase RutF
VPVIAEAPSAFVCRVAAVHEAGDHSLFIGAVEAIEHNPAETPLLFFCGKYRSLQPAD